MDEGFTPSAIAEASDAAANAANSPETPVSSAPNWHFSDNVPGQGEKPDWFVSDKYKTVSDQARAYRDVERMMHEKSSELAKYKGEAIEKYDWGENFAPLAESEPMMRFTEILRRHNVPQDSFNEAFETLAEFDRSRIPDPAKEMEALGPDAHKKLEILSQWATNELPEEFHDTFGNLSMTAKAINMFDAMRQKMSATTGITPPSGSSAPASEMKMSRADVQQEMNNNSAKYLSDPQYREEIRRKFAMTEHEGGFAEKTF